MAILNALAAEKGCNLFDLLHPRKDTSEISSNGCASIKVCGLIDSDGTPAQMARVAHLLVEEGFSAIKLKVRLSL